ncbi:unnamed protein product [Haemonchus placei]|uniref:Transmembrane protein n=1 Tax=Haemonchus placei TaxID=6290 RepID=A0A0N4W9K9_HAEPC|nr:unnamed protein product [Haemonchus placei]
MSSAVKMSLLEGYGSVCQNRARISLVKSGSTLSHESFYELRRSNMRIPVTPIERLTRSTKLDFIAGIFLLFVCDMLLLSFTF